MNFTCFLPWRITEPRENTKNFRIPDEFVEQTFLLLEELSMSWVASPPFFTEMSQ